MWPGAEMEGPLHCMKGQTERTFGWIYISTKTGKNRKQAPVTFFFGRMTWLVGFFKFDDWLVCLMVGYFIVSMMSFLEFIIIGTN